MVKGRPPKICQWLIRRAVGTEWSETALGDLNEEFVQEQARHGPLRARLWYAAQTLLVTAGSVRQALGRTASFVGHLLLIGDQPMRSTAREIRAAIRTLSRQPSLVLVVLLTLGLGVGVNAATFSILNALVLRPLSLREADRLVMLAELTTGEDDSDRQESVAPADFYEWRNTARSLDRVAAYDWWWVNLAGGNEPEHVLGFQVTGDFFDVAGTRPALGRFISQADEVWGRDHVVVLSDQLWRRRFGARADVVGQTIRLQGQPYTVIGVAPPDFDFPMRAEVWGAFGASPARQAARTSRSLTVIGRLRPGASLDDARAEMTVIGARERRLHPVENKDRDVHVYTLAYGLMDIGLPSILGLVQAGAIFVLLIAGLNLSNLLLAGNTDRQREFSIRLALGASRARIVRQLVIENAVMGAGAVPVAVGCAWLAMRLLKQAMPARMERYVNGWAHLGVDGRVLVATLAMTVVAACLVGLIPAIRATSVDINSVLKEGGRSATPTRSRRRLQSALVIGEVALVMPLLVASGLAVVAAGRFATGPQGYDPSHLLTLHTSLPEATYANATAQQQFTERLLDRVSGLTGVEAVGMANALPGDPSNGARAIQVDGAPDVGQADLPMIAFRIISPNYFETLRMPLVEGRRFTDEDRTGSQLVAIVNHAMAARFWAGGDPVGRRFRIVDTPERPQPWLTIVGVVGDTIDDWFSRRNAPMFYASFRQMASTHPAFAVRTTATDPTTVAPSVLRALHDLDPDEPASDVMSMDQLLHDRTAGIVMIGGMMAVLGSLALALAIVGLYSLLAYFVARRRHEIGLRMALGAGRARVLGLTLRHALWLSGIGLALGLGLAMLLARAMEGALFGVMALDPRLVLAAAMIIVVTTFVAAVLPARRATHTDPAVALRES